MAIKKAMEKVRTRAIKQLVSHKDWIYSLTENGDVYRFSAKDADPKRRLVKFETPESEE